MKKKINHSGVQGATFGVMEAVIMVIAVMLGLSVTNNKSMLFLGIITAGLADAFGNASAFHVAQETEKHHKEKEVLKSTVLCFFSTLITVFVMVFPLFFLEIKKGIIASAILGILIIIGLGIYVSKVNKRFETKKLIAEYVLIAVVASAACYYIGKLVVYLS